MALVPPERHVQETEQFFRFLVRLGGRDEIDVHPLDPADLVIVDLREDDLLLDA